MWGTCNHRSDWDLIIIVQHLHSKKPLNSHKGSLDAFILTKEIYLEQLEEHSMQVLLTLWLPLEYILKHQFDPRGNFTFSKPKLVASLSASRDRDLRIAEKHFHKGNFSQARKVVVHCIRYVDIGIQVKYISKTGSLLYTSANEYRETVISDYSKTWEKFMISVQPILERLWSKLIECGETS